MKKRSCLGQLSRPNASTDTIRVDGDTLSAVMSLVDPNEAVSQLKHVVTQTYDDELGVLGAFLEQKTKQSRPFFLF